MKIQNLLNSSRFSARLTTLFVMLVTLSMFSISAVTAELPIGDIDYTLDATAMTMTIDTYKGAGGAVDIPDSYIIEGVTYDVIGIAGSAFFNDPGKLVTSVVLPNTLIFVGERAFQQTEITPTITIPASVDSIGKWGFADMGTITSVIFEDESQLTFIGKQAFRSAGNVTLPSVRTGFQVHWYIDGGAELTDLTVAQATWSGEDAYEAIWLDVSTIVNGTLAFNANGAEGGTMGDLATTLGLPLVLSTNSFTRAGYFFKGWAATTDGEVIYGDGVRFTPAGVTEELFAIWGQLSQLTFNANGGEGTMSAADVSVGFSAPLPSNTFTKAGYYLYGWSTTVDGSAFYSDGADYTPLTMGDNLYAVWAPNPDDFQSVGMEMLKVSDFTYTLSGTSLTITKYTGAGQDSTYLYIPSTYVVEGAVCTVVSVGNDSFADQFANVSNVILPNTLTYVGIRAFQKCYLDSITIPASVTKIGKFAFRLATSVAKVTFEDESQLEEIGTQAFTSTALVSFTLPSIRTGYSSVEWKEGAVVITDYVVLPSQFGSIFSAEWTEIVTAVDETSAIKEQLVISPNPADHSFTLNVKAISTDIYSLSGKCVKQFPMGVSTFDVSSLERGVYFVKAQEANGNVLVEQLVKQ